MTVTPKTKMTQRRIAELAGVSQATVSLVLNGKTDSAARIPDATRQRVLDVIAGTSYVADPAARRLAGVGNKIIGVFTYEQAFPTQSIDFYTPLLTGIEAEAEHLGCDLLIFTSAPVENGRRRLFHENSRLGLADGALLLGREMDPTELARLVEMQFPFVAVGRRDVDGVPYVGVDYATGTAQLVRRAIELGHEELFLLHLDSTGESGLDRQMGFLAEVSAHATARYATAPSSGDDLRADWRSIRAFAPSVLVVESPDHATELVRIAREDGVEIPRDLSLVVLGEPAVTHDQATDFTRLSPPRVRLGAEAAALLSRILDPGDDPGPEELRFLLDCELAAGTTLIGPAATR